MAKKKVTEAKKEEVKKEPGTDMAVFKPSSVAGLALPAGAKVTRHVTLPSLAIKTEGMQCNLFFMDAMRESKIKDKESKREPATICTVGDLDKGGQFILIIPAVVKANLERDYPEHSYVGKSFAIKNMGKRTEAQRYNDFAIAEIDVPSDFIATKPSK